MLRIAVVEDDPEHRATLVAYVRRFFSDGSVPTAPTAPAASGAPVAPPSPTAGAPAVPAAPPSPTAPSTPAEPYECVTFGDGADLLAAYPGGATGFDIVLLDIVMPRSDGLEVARRIRQSDARTVIVFVTEAVQFALEGYTVQASDFLVKPLYYTSFRSAMLRALATVSRRAPHFIQIPYDKSSALLDVASIVFIETRGKRTVVHATSGDYDCSLTMRELEARLQPHGFGRCHQAFIVNVAFIESVRKTEVVVRGHTIPISRNKREKFIETILREVGATI